MNTTNPTIHVEYRRASVAGRLTARKVIATTAAGLLAVTASAAIVANAGTTSRGPEPETTPTIEHRAVTEHLVNAGAIPWRSLLPVAPANDPIIRNLVERGAIPSQSLVPVAPTDNPIIRDLVERAVIPREALLPAANRPGA